MWDARAHRSNCSHKQSWFQLELQSRSCQLASLALFGTSVWDKSSLVWDARALRCTCSPIKPDFNLGCEQIQSALLLYSTMGQTQHVRDTKLLGVNAALYNLVSAWVAEKLQSSCTGYGSTLYGKMQASPTLFLYSNMKSSIA